MSVPRRNLGWKLRTPGGEHNLGTTAYKTVPHTLKWRRWPKMQKWDAASRFLEFRACWQWYLLTPNAITLKWVSFLFSHPSLRVERWKQGRREGPSEIPLCVGLESFCLCELNIKQSWAASGSLKWWGGGYQSWIQACASTCYSSKQILLQCKNGSTKGLLSTAQDQGWVLIYQLPFLSYNKGTVDSI